MPRQKNERTINFKPITTDFLPVGVNDSDVISLLPEEIESIYLMDLLNLYQEEAAQKMEVSRSTFARIIKSARQKIATSILNGKSLHLITVKNKYIVAFCSNSKEIFENLEPKNQFICILKIDKNSIISKLFLDNPIYLNNSKPAKILPEIFINHDVNFFITSKIGEGLKNSMNAKGINIIKQNNFDINSLKNIF
jgi:predicted DNA-binding protein (UPF0251 family)/predicted Fe-Mo cluster-binding NifX family protein